MYWPNASWSICFTQWIISLENQLLLLFSFCLVYWDLMSDCAQIVTLPLCDPNASTMFYLFLSNFNTHDAPLILLNLISRSVSSSNIFHKMYLSLRCGGCDWRGRSLAWASLSYLSAGGSAPLLPGSVWLMGTGTFALCFTWNVTSVSSIWITPEVDLMLLCFIGWILLSFVSLSQLWRRRTAGRRPHCIWL